MNLFPSYNRWGNNHLRCPELSLYHFFPKQVPQIPNKSLSLQMNHLKKSTLCNTMALYQKYKCNYGPCPTTSLQSLSTILLSEGVRPVTWDHFRRVQAKLKRLRLLNVESDRVCEEVFQGFLMGMTIQTTNHTLIQTSSVLFCWEFHWGLNLHFINLIHFKCSVQWF